MDKKIDYDIIENERKEKKKGIKAPQVNIPQKPIKPQKPQIQWAPVILFVVGVIEVFWGIGLEFSFVTICGGVVAVFSLFGIYVQIEEERQYINSLKKYERDLYNYIEEMKQINVEIQKTEI